MFTIKRIYKAINVAWGNIGDITSMVYFIYFDEEGLLYGISQGDAAGCEYFGKAAQATID
jgi:hypothetical protein